MFGHVTRLECSVCGAQYAPGLIYLCEKCGGNLNAVYDVQKSFGPAAGYWRYLPMLPLPQDKVPDTCLPVGGTPLIQTDKLAAEYGLSAGDLYVKDESRNPSGSLKDRASFLLVEMARAHKIPSVITASTGNAGCALACCCAPTSVAATILVPKAAPAGKIAQLLAFGAKVMLVDGCYDDAFALCSEVAKKRGLFNRNTGMNPFTSEGKKTVSFEVFEQLGTCPDAVFVSVGDGNIITGVYKGFKNLLDMGKIDHMPRLMGCQSAKSNFFCVVDREIQEKGIKDHKEVAEFVHKHAPLAAADTRADSIAAELPSDRVNAYFAVKSTGGAFVEVTDEEILAEIPVVSRNSGVFPEPAAACAFAGLRKVAPELRGKRVVVISTGTCLKDVRALDGQGLRGIEVKTVADVEAAL